MKQKIFLSGDELLLKEYQLNCHALHTEKVKMLIVKQNLVALTKKNEITFKSLTNTKNECELYRTHLHKTLFNHKVAADKEKIISRKKLNEFLEKKKRTEEYIKKSPFKLELEELMKKNARLQEEYKKKSDLLELTKQQYNELMKVVMKTFKNKLCEFCLTVLKCNSVEKKEIK